MNNLNFMVERRMPSPEDMGIAKTEKETPPYKILSNEQGIVSQISRESLYELAENGDPNAFTKVGIVTYRRGMSRRSGRLDMIRDRLSAVTLSPEVDLDDEESLNEMARSLAKDRVPDKKALGKVGMEIRYVPNQDIASWEKKDREAQEAKKAAK